MNFFQNRHYRTKESATAGVNWFLYRLVLAWILSSTVLLLLAPAAFTSKSFYDQLPLPVIGLMTAAFLGLLMLLRSRTALTILMVGSASFYSIIAVTQNESSFFAFGCCAFLAGIVLFSPIEDISPVIGRRSLRLAGILMILLFTLWIGGVCCLAYLHHSTPNYDFGIFSQMYHYMRKTGLPLTTCERDRLLSHFAVHISPILYTLLPAYLLAPSPLTIQILGSLLVASGVIPLLLLCRRHGISRGASIIIAGIYISYPAFIGGCFSWFHENNFLTPLLLWMFLAFDSRRPAAMAVSALSVCLVKEDAPMYAAVLTLYFILRDARDHRKAVASNKASALTPAAGLKLLAQSLKVWIFIFCVLYFCLAVSILSRYGDGAMVGRYSNYIYDGSTSLLTMFRAIFQNPIYVISQCFTNETILSSFEIFVPLGFLPLFLSSWEELVLLIPYVLMNMMSSYYYQHMLGYQYYFGSCSFLFYLAVINYARNGQSPVTRISAPRKKCLVIGLCSSMVLSVCLWQGKLLDYLPGYIRNTPEREAVTEILDMIPKDAETVAATALLVPDLTDRDKVYEVFYTKHRCEYVAIDLRTRENRDFYREYSKDIEYELVAEIPDAAALFHKKDEPLFYSER